MYKIIAFILFIFLIFDSTAQNEFARVDSLANKKLIEKSKEKSKEKNKLKTNSTYTDTSSLVIEKKQKSPQKKQKATQKTQIQTLKPSQSPNQIFCLKCSLKKYYFSPVNYKVPA